MELVSIVQEVIQNGAEQAASYRAGQTALRYLDRMLWVVEKSARWAVPPPLDLDERPQPELVRPLPWAFFLILLLVLRMMRELLSLVNLVLGKPPIRSADMVIYIQGKRRYLRTLKYQGCRAMRARRGSTNSAYSSIWTLLDFTMCFRRQGYGNHNTSASSDEVMIVKRSKGDGGDSVEVAQAAETTMERLIEKMMVDVEADSDDSHSYTLTNVTSVRSDKSEYTDSEHEAAFTGDTKKSEITEDETENFSAQNNIATSTPEKNNCVDGKAVPRDNNSVKSVLNSCSTREASSTFILQESRVTKDVVTTKKNIIMNGKTNKTKTTSNSSFGQSRK